LARIGVVVAAVTPGAVVRSLDLPPVFGAAVEPLRWVSADGAARDTRRAALTCPDGAP
jgi:hypothetical protein